MKNNGNALDEVKSTMASAGSELKNIIDSNPNQKANLVATLWAFLHRIIETTADLAKLSSLGLKQRIYEDIEAATSRGGIEAIHALGDGFCLSDIQPDDTVGAMNYLGQEMSKSLFRGLYELPKPLQNEEVLLRAIEALLTNLLDQKFSNQNNSHDILDSFCDHVHMALDDLQNTSSDKKTTMNSKQSPNDPIEAIVKNINNQANDILLNGGGDEELLLSLNGVMGEIKKVMDTSTQQEIDAYCQEYSGFYRYMSLLNQLARGIADGIIEVPK